VCDTLCVVGPAGTLFAKNSDRPPREPQVVETLPARPGGGTQQTQYLALTDQGAAAMLGSRPTWLFGCEHGVNEHRVAIGNEKVWTIDDARAAPPALIGMDLVRLALERAATADDALEHLTALLTEHGQGGSGEQEHDEPYFSSFLIADPRGGWVVETSGRTWAAQPVADGAAISNRISLGTEWTRASDDVPPGRDFQTWRDPAAPTGIADHRLTATRACVAGAHRSGALAVGPADLVATLRDHGAGPWGAPGGAPRTSPVPTEIDADWHGVTVCMHVGDYQATTASMVADLPVDVDAPMRAWVALGSPCASVYVPVFPPGTAPAALGEASTWARFAALARRVESEPDALDRVRGVLAPVEADLWEQADHAVKRGTAAALDGFTGAAWAPVDDALVRLGV
jgi:dipeptidase